MLMLGSGLVGLLGYGRTSREIIKPSQKPPRWTSMSRTVAASVTKPMIRIAPPHLGQRTGKNAWMRASSSILGLIEHCATKPTTACADLEPICCMAGCGRSATVATRPVAARRATEKRSFASYPDQHIADIGAITELPCLHAQAATAEG